MTPFKSSAKSPSKSLRYLFLAGAIATIPLSNNVATAQSAVESTAIAQAAEQTLVLCETDSTAIRIYTKGADTLMRAFSREQNRVVMNDTPTELGDMPNATAYRNLVGELNITLMASKSADDCSIAIRNQSAEDGRLLADNRPAAGEEAQILPIETQADATVTGTLSYRARIRLVPGAVVTTQLVDLTGGSAIAEQTITTTGEQVPLPFTLAYSPRDIIPGHRYVVKANIFVEDELRWTTQADYPVITQRSPLTADVVLVMADSRTEPSIQPVPLKEPSIQPVPSEGPSIQPVPSEGPSIQPVPSEGPSIQPVPSEGPSIQPVPSEGPSIQPVPSEGPSIQPVPSEGDSTLPSNVEQAVKAALTEYVGAAAFMVTNYSRETWSDGCLGLGGPDELCLSALTEGWQVEVLDPATDLSYIYRTNETGNVVRLASEGQ